MKPTYFAQFDGEEINGERYAVGDPIKGDLDEATVEILMGLGRISTNRPAAGSSIPPIEEKAIEDMSRTELEAAAIEAVRYRAAQANTNDLRNMVQRHRDERDEAARGDDDDGDQGGEGDDEGEDDKPETVSALTARIATITERSALDVERHNEVVGQNRESAVKAIDKRIAALG